MIARMTSMVSRMTRQREVILEALGGMMSHPTAYEVYEVVKRRLPRISMGTVYRNLQLLSETGIILSLGSPETQRRFDSNSKQHYHVRCSNCRAVKDVFIEPFGDLDSMASEATGYRVNGHTVEFYGLCPDCYGNAEAQPVGSMQN